MGDTRIKVAKDKAQLVKSLRTAENPSSPFQSYADVLVFAATLGIQSNARQVISEYSKEIDPIRQDIFYGKGYDQVINLIAVADKNNPRILAQKDNTEEERIKVFEEYTNAGLEILANLLSGSTNYTEQILIFLTSEHYETKKKEEEFDLSKFL